MTGVVNGESPWPSLPHRLHSLSAPDAARFHRAVRSAGAHAGRGGDRRVEGRRRAEVGNGADLRRSRAARRYRKLRHDHDPGRARPNRSDAGSGVHGRSEAAWRRREVHDLGVHRFAHPGRRRAVAQASAPASTGPIANCCAMFGAIPDRRARCARWQCHHRRRRHRRHRHRALALSPTSPAKMSPR